MNVDVERALQDGLESSGITGFEAGCGFDTEFSKEMVMRNPRPRLTDFCAGSQCALVVVQKVNDHVNDFLWEGPVGIRLRLGHL